MYATQPMILSEETITFDNFCDVEEISLQSKTTKRGVTDGTNTDKQEQRLFLK
jgi:hypothetical protein